MSGEVPGGMTVINALRWVLVGTTGIYVLPILTYVFLFKKTRILCQIIMGAFSFIFYSPTYLNILNIYSLCRIDDISWGTKGLESGSGGNSKLKDSWKLIKFVHVAKYVFWNIIAGVLLLSFGSSYTPRFFITISLIGLIGFSLTLKIIVSVVYMIKYKLSTCLCCSREEGPELVDNSRMQGLM
jgi:chitin synthase